METSASAPGQNAGTSSRAQYSEEQGQTRILRTILKEASVQSPLASAPSYGALDRYSGSKGLKNLFYRTHKQKDGLLERIRAQDRFATPQEERGLICWRERGEKPGRDGKGALKYAWLSSHARTGFLVSSEWILYIECVNSSKITSVSGFSSSGTFVEIRRYLHNTVHADDGADDGNPGIYGSTSTNLGETSVRINDVPIEINVRVGPLPSYAVIEMNGSSVFWWRTKEALNFVPKKTRPLKSFLDSQGYENLGAALPDFKRQKLSSREADTAINRLGGSVARNEEEESVQSPNRTRALTEGRYRGNGAGDAATTAAPSSTAAPPNTTNAENTDTAIIPALSEAGTKDIAISSKKHPKRAHFIENPSVVDEPSSALPRPNWKAKLKRGLQRHKASQRHAEVPNILDKNEYSEFDDALMKKSPLENEKDLTDDEVVKGIIALWTALQNQGKYFAFGSTNTFLGYRSKNFNVRDLAVKGPKYPFIMPLVFPPDLDDTEHGMPKSKFDRRKGKNRPSPEIGHHLLAVARVADGHILVTVLNSLHNYVKRKKIEEVATSVVTGSGWLGKDESGDNPLPVWPTVKFEYPRVPTQEGLNTCGLYVILNAWATMLELEITPQRTRRRLPQKESPQTPFVAALMELINLAIAGHLDTETIVAFLVSYGYILEPRDLDSVPKVQLDQNFNQNLVAQALYESCQQDKVELAKAPNQHIADEDVQYVMDKTGCTHKWAKAAVENSRGVRNLAPFFVPPKRRATHFENLYGV